MIGGKLGQIPLVTVVVVVIDPIVNGTADVLEGGPERDLGSKLVLQMAEEAFLRGIVPAVTPAGHRLAQGTTPDELDEFHTGIVATLIAVKDSPVGEGNAVVLHETSHSFQDEVHFQGLAEDIGEDLLGAGIEDCGEVAVSMRGAYRWQEKPDVLSLRICLRITQT